MRAFSSLWRRAGGSLRRHPRLAGRLERVLRPVEIATKRPLFGCQMCGQCVLHSTGMVCPMTCPKNLRNGPCGGVDLDGSCEVSPDMTCIWVNAFRRSQQLPWPDEIHDLRAPVDWSLQDSSSWVNSLTGRDKVSSGCQPGPGSALEVIRHHGG